MCFTLKVMRSSKTDASRLIVRMNHDYRDGAGRWAVVRIRCADTSKTVLALALGHDTKNAIFLPYDVRSALKVEEGTSYNFQIAKVGWLGTIRWWLCSKDPAVRIPAWLAVWSVGLGAASLIIAIWSLGLGEAFN